MEKGYALFMSARGGDSKLPNGSAAAPIDEDDACERRSTERVDVLWSVDCETEDTFLYAAITNISAMCIFVRTTEPRAVGTSVTLRFAPPHATEPFVLGGEVAWVNRVRPRSDNPNPGMGIRFVALSRDDRFGNRTGVFRRNAVTKKNPDNQARKFAEAYGLWHRAILGSPLAGTTRGDAAPRRKWRSSRLLAAG